MNPPVSVIIPCYNVEAFVQRQIDAVLPQLGPEDELILVDNRSTDRTHDILARAALTDQRIRITAAADKAGANYARNAGMKAARHFMFLFCDADDIVQPGWVEAMRRILRLGGIVGGAAIPVDGNGAQVAPEIQLHTIFGGPEYPLGGNMGIRREVVARVGGFDESFQGGHDETDLAWRAFAAGWPTLLAPDARIKYVQRPAAEATARQKRSFARTSIQLWVQHPETVNPHGVSFKGALLGLARHMPSGWRLARRRGTADDAVAWGWNLGLVEGHVRYRILRRIPPHDTPKISGLTDSR